MTNETKSDLFCRVSMEFSDSLCSRNLLINILIESAHCDCEKNVSREQIGVTMCRERVESSLYQGIILQTCSRQNMHSKFPYMCMTFSSHIKEKAS